MYRVIIVEDEMLVRMGLKNTIQWEDFDMQVVADAENGITALEMYRKEKPDLIITDLKMPGMSGMELIARIRENDKSVKFVILTCLEEFELVRKAISMGVTDYILKLTMTMERISAVLARVSEELSADRNRRTSNTVTSTDINLIKEKIIRDHILCEIYSEKEFAALAQRYGFRFVSGRMIVCALEIDQFSRIKTQFQDENGQLIKHSLLNILNEILSKYGNSEAVHDSNARYVILFGIGDVPGSKINTDRVISILKEIEVPVKSYFNTSISYGMSEIGSGYLSLRKMYEQALTSLEDKFIGASGIYGPGITFGRNDIKALKTDDMLKLCEKIPGISSVFFNDYSERINSIMNSGFHTRAEYLDMYCRLVQWAVNVLKFQEEGSEQSIISAIQAIQQSETLDEVYRYLYEFLSRISAAKRRKKITSREVKLALDYMESNYSRDLSLQQVSAHVGLSPSYLSSLFKKEIDVNFIEYLNEIRIEKAKELLLETYLKTYEIAESVGFNENTYFCKMFKKLSGLTPGEYRKQWLKKWSEEPEDEASRQ